MHSWQTVAESMLVVYKPCLINLAITYILYIGLGNTCSVLGYKATGQISYLCVKQRCCTSSL